METNPSHISEDIKKFRSICAKKHITDQDVNVGFQIIQNYFGKHGRPKEFVDVFLDLCDRFTSFLEHCSLPGGIVFASNAFHLGYTISEDKSLYQRQIFEVIAEPYEIFIEKNCRKASINFQYEGASNNEILIVCRHGQTEGLYAPGKAIYSYAASLAESGQKISILSLGELQEDFKNLGQNSENIRVMRLKERDTASQLKVLTDIFNVLKPKALVTEMEFGMPSVISIVNKKVNSFLMSQGFFDLPWYRKVFVPSDTVINDSKRPQKDFVRYPSFILPELLAKDRTGQRVSEAKCALGIQPNDFVIGSFGRMEKFTEEFLKDLSSVLMRNSNAKVLLAGPNDRSNVERLLKKHIGQGRAMVLGQSDTHLLGKCCSISLDTYPSPAGHAALEFHAKGVPVVYKNTKEVENFKSQRIETLRYNSRAELNNLVRKLSTDRRQLTQFQELSIELVNTVQRQNSHKFASIMEANFD